MAILAVLDSWHMFVWPCDCFIVWLHVFQDFYSSIINFPVRVDTFKHKNHVSSPYRSDSSYRLKLATLSMRGSSPSTQGVCGLTLLWRKYDISMSSKHQNSVILFACITSAPNDKTLKTYITQTEKSFLNLGISKQIWIVIILFRLVANQSEKSNYNPNLVWFNNVHERFLSVWSFISSQTVSDRLVSEK